MNEPIVTINLFLTWWQLILVIVIPMAVVASIILTTQLVEEFKR